MSKEFERIEKVTRVMLSKPLAAVLYTLYFLAHIAFAKSKVWIRRRRGPSQAETATRS